MPWQRMRVWQHQDWQTGSLVFLARRRDAPGEQVYALAVGIARELREDVVFLRGQRVLRRFEKAIRERMKQELDSEPRCYRYVVHAGEHAVMHDIRRVRLRSLRELPRVREGRWS